MKKLTQGEAASMIPSGWNLVVKSAEDIMFLGSVMIREMIRAWRRKENELKPNIKAAHEKVTFFTGMNAVSLSEFAKNYENPEFPDIGYLRDSEKGVPEPLDPASRRRKCKSTTFNVCGWCKYASTGAKRYEYYFSTNCSLRRDAGLEDIGFYTFNTPCFLKTAPDTVFDQLRAGLEEGYQSRVTERREVENKIRLLVEMEKLAEKKPPLPGYRPMGWFEAGNLVVCSLENDPREDFVDVSAVEADFDEVLVSYLKPTQGMWYIAHDPQIMHRWEFDYLLSHADFAIKWARQGAVWDKEFNAEDFLDALIREKQGRLK